MVYTQIMNRPGIHVRSPLDDRGCNLRRSQIVRHGVLNYAVQRETTLKLTPLQREQVLQWKAGMEAMNAFVLQERKAATYQERFRSVQSLWQFGRTLGVNSAPPLDLSVNDKWQKLRKAHDERIR